MSTKDEKYYRVIFLGAGFSHAAGLPLGKDLSEAIITYIENEFEEDSPLYSDLRNFTEYKKRCDMVDLAPRDIDFEEFLSFLDTEHFLGLRGSDTWSKEGNEGQVLIKQFIGKYIHDRTPHVKDIPEFYFEFARCLQPGDFVLTFNYDILLERCLEHINKPYRLFPTRYFKIGRNANIIDSSQEEVILLKMHGSVDWFDRTFFEEMQDFYKEQGHTDLIPPDPIFADPMRYEPFPIVDGPRNHDDPLNTLYRIKYVDYFYSHRTPPSIPWILSPSKSKILYSHTVHEFWHGLGQAGGWNLGLSIIGFSMPEHDDYVKQALYQITRNYQESWWEENFFGKKKTKMKLIDFRTSLEELEALKTTYSFINWQKALIYDKGFDEKSVELIFIEDH